MSKLWNLIELPVYGIIIWSVLSIFLQVYGAVPLWLISVMEFGVVIIAFGWIGRSMQGKGFLKAAKPGAIAGAIVGFVSAILGIFSFYFFPQIYVASIEQMAARGVPADAIQTYLTIGVYFGLLSGPVLNAGVGAIISGLSSMIKWQKK